MNFIKHIWTWGELVTPDLFNRIENAIDSLAQDSSEATDSDCDELFDGFLEDEE